MNKKVKCTLQNALYNGHVAVHKPRHIYVGSGMHNRNQLKGINDWNNPKTTMPSNSNLDPDDFRRERQIRRIAKYRNNCYFVGSPESGVRFARLMSHFANIRKHNLDPVEYLCDVFRRIKKTAKDKLVDLLAHRWQQATVTAWA